MQPNGLGLTSARSSPVSLAQPREPYDPIDDDRSIARELLQVAPPERPVLARHSVTLQGLDRSQRRRPELAANAFQDGRPRRANRTSNTWTSSDGDVLSDKDEVDDRTVFIEEYNRLAKKHGVRVMNEDWEQINDDINNLSPKTGWFRRILRRTSSSQSVKIKPERHLKHRRSISDLSLRLKLKRDKLKDKDLQELVRLCGASILYLPAEYAAGSLSVPTCFRATAQHLVQYGISTRGIFRIPGSHNVVSALYNHYCSTDEYGQVIAGTVRCPTLPDHIKCDVHDVASAFKKFLSGLPGGILGSLQLLDALISIQSQLAGQAELTRTKQSKVRARLIALAIATLRSQYRRELICAVFGLLCMIGRTAETTQREDSRGRPLPTSDLMGYGPLGIVFGPLLVGDLLEDYTMRIADPHRGLVLLPISPPKSRKERQKKAKSGEEGSAFNTHVDKSKVVNGITEMLITHWRDVIRHMRNLNAIKNVASIKSLAVRGIRQQVLRPSASESFALRRPPDWADFKAPLTRRERSESPTPTQRPLNMPKIQTMENYSDTLVVRKQRSGPRPMSSQRLSTARSMNILSPTLEENSKDEHIEASSLAASIQKLVDRSTSDSDEIQRPPDVEIPDAKVEEIVGVGNSSRQKPGSSSESPLRSTVPTHVPTSQHSSPLPPIPRPPTAHRPVLARLPPARSLFSRPPTPSVVRSVAFPGSASHTGQIQSSSTVKKPDMPAQLPLYLSQVPARSSKAEGFELSRAFHDVKGMRFSFGNSEEVGASSGGFNETVEMHEHNTMAVTTRQVAVDAVNASIAMVPAPSIHKIKSTLAGDNATKGLGNLRQISTSKPGLQHISPHKPNRRTSKSLYEDPRRKRNLIDWSKLPFERDALSRVSLQEDSASLTSLAEAMNFDESNPFAFGDESHTLVASTGDSSSDDHHTESKVNDSPKPKNVLRKLQRGNGRGSTAAVDATSRQENRSSIVDIFRKDINVAPTNGTSSSPQNITILDDSLRAENNPISTVNKETPSHVETASKNAIQGKQVVISSQIQVPRDVYNPFGVDGSHRRSSALTSGHPSPQPSNYSAAQRSGSPSKISALVARFNTTSTPLLPANRSPPKTPVKIGPRFYKQPLKSPGDSLVAPYTTNEPSPTKSQKSSKSEKSPHSRRSPLLKEKTTKDSIPVESSSAEPPNPTQSSTPKRLLRISLHDPTPLRSTRQVPEKDDPPSKEPSPGSFTYSRTQSIRKSFENRNEIAIERQRGREPAEEAAQCKPSLEIESSVLSPMPSSRKSIPQFYENSFGSSRQLGLVKSPFLTRQQSRDSMTTGSISPRMTSPKPSQPSDSQTKFKPPKSFLSRLEYARTASPVESLVDVPAFDGPGSIDATAEELSSQVRRALKAQQKSTSCRAILTLEPRVSDLVHPDSPFGENFTTSQPTSTAGSPPSRRETLLFKQVRNLRHRITDKSEQIRYLRNQIESLRVTDMERSADLDEARKGIEMWKARAEKAETELVALTSKILSKRGTRGLLANCPNFLLSRSDSFQGAHADHFNSIFTGLETSKSSDRATDGSSNLSKDEFGMSKSWNSEESTGTVFRDMLDVIDGSDYSSWAKRMAEST